MGTWCTEGVKRIQAEHRREEDAEERRAYNTREEKRKEKCAAKGICSECGRKIIKKKKSSP